jgi:hypothetical protein
MQISYYFAKEQIIFNVNSTFLITKMWPFFSTHLKAQVACALMIAAQDWRR